MILVFRRIVENVLPLLEKTDVENPLIEELTVKDNLKFWGWDSKNSEGKLEEQFEMYIPSLRYIRLLFPLGWYLN